MSVANHVKVNIFLCSINCRNLFGFWPLKTREKLRSFVNITDSTLRRAEYNLERNAFITPESNLAPCRATALVESKQGGSAGEASITHTVQVFNVNSREKKHSD